MNVKHLCRATALSFVALAATGTAGSLYPASDLPAAASGGMCFGSAGTVGAPLGNPPDTNVRSIAALFEVASDSSEGGAGYRLLGWIYRGESGDQWLQPSLGRSLTVSGRSFFISTNGFQVEMLPLPKAMRLSERAFEKHASVAIRTVNGSDRISTWSCA